MPLVKAYSMKILTSDKKKLLGIITTVSVLSCFIIFFINSFFSSLIYQDWVNRC